MSSKPIDGKNIWKLLSGKNSKSPYNKEGFYYLNKKSELEAVRKGDWKLRIVKDQVALYNLKEDISERNNIAADDKK